MTAPAVLAAALWVLGGCAASGMTRAERSFLEGVSFRVMDLSRAHPPLGGFERRTAEWGPNFFSFTYKSPKAGDVPLFNREYFWFKVSLAKDPIEGFDSPEPVLTMYLPKFSKYLKLRVRGADEALLRDLAAAVQEKGLEAGGVPRPGAQGGHPQDRPPA